MYIVISVIEKPGDLRITPVNHINGRKQALDLLEQVCREHIATQAGRPAAEFAKIIDVENLNKIDVPSDDGHYMVRLVSNPDRIDIYKRYTKANRGIIYNSYENIFQKEISFYLTQYDKITNFNMRNEEIDLVTVAKNVKIPRGMTVAPYIEMIRELASNDKFKGRFTLSQSCVN